MKLNKIITRGAFAIAAASTLAVMPVTAQAKDWRGWNIHVDGYPNTVAMDKFAELV